MEKLVIDIRGRVVLLVHTGVAYTPEEWRSIVALTERADLADLRFLVYDDRGSISAAQRSELIEGMKRREPMAAVFTRSAISRGITTAIGWFKPGIKAFDPDQFEKAARYLGLTDEESALARKTVERVERQLSRAIA